MNSMTGYGFKEEVVDNTQISIEIRSVNSRFLDLNVNLPSFLNALESRIRKLIGEKIFRGKVDLSIRVKDLEVKSQVSLNREEAKKYVEILGEINSLMNSSSSEKENILSSGQVLTFIASQEGVLNVSHETDPELYWPKIERILVSVLNAYCEDRRREGENLKKDILKKLDILDDCASFFEEWQPKMETKFKEQLTSRFKEIAGDYTDENRILSETAAMLVKYTINEEIIRLKSHLDSLRKEICENPLPGKKMDFICQEANREINTIGSKNQFIEVGQRVISAKDALENIREQAKNVE